MKLKVLRKIEDKINLEITGATLLSIEEAEALPNHVRAYTNWWWLRSPGYHSYLAAYVSDSGGVFTFGSNVNHSAGAVRPALKIKNFKSSGLKIGDSIFFDNKEFEIISDGLAFCKTNIGVYCFRSDYNAKDANNYKKSDIKIFVDVWFKDAKKAEEKPAPHKEYSYPGCMCC